LVGGRDNDLLLGQNGNDRFVFTAGDGIDRIVDFVAGNNSGDIIELNGYGVTNFTVLQQLMVQSGADVVITFDAANQITLSNVQLAALNQGDFVLL
jgi:Ca2+-binding RTX toxin-like protein